MKSIVNSLEELMKLTNAAVSITEELASLRNSLSDKDWENLDNLPVSKLIELCLDLEYIVETNS